MNPKYRAFIEHYLQCWVGTEAARRAGYKGTPETIRVQASRILAHPEVQAAIRQRLSEMAMGADEVLARLSLHARGATEECLKVNEQGELVMDWNAFADPRLRGLIKKVTLDGRRVAQVEFHDPQAALIQLARVYGMFKDRAELAISEPAVVRVVWGNEVQNSSDESQDASDEAQNSSDEPRNCL